MLDALDRLHPKYAYKAAAFFTLYLPRITPSSTTGCVLIGGFTPEWVTWGCHGDVSTGEW